PCVGDPASGSARRGGRRTLEGFGRGRQPGGPTTPGTPRKGQDKNCPNGRHLTDLPPPRSPSPHAAMTETTLLSTIETTPPRRRFLKMLAVSVAAAGALAAPGEAEARRGKKQLAGVLVHRLQTRKHYSCNACKKHHKAMVFRTHALADQNRANKGCTRPIIRQLLPKKQFKHLFGKGGVAPGGVADLRTVS